MICIRYLARYAMTRHFIVAIIGYPLFQNIKVDGLINILESF